MNTATQSAPVNSTAHDPSRPNIRREVEGDVCFLVFDRPNSSANIFDEETLLALESHIAFVEQTPALRRVIFLSAKRSIFIAGADVHMLESMARHGNLDEIISRGQNLFQRVAGLDATTVAAIHGACAGGGCELALACDWRIASTASATRIGLPETQLGILPAWGGSTRLPRLIGLASALDLVLSGRLVSAAKARRIGLVDATTAPELLRARAIEISASTPDRPRRVWERLAAPLIEGAAARRAHRTTRGNYPAVRLALETVSEAARRPLQRGLELEREAVRHLAATPECAHLLRIFHLQERSKNLLSEAPDHAAPLSHCAIIGAGVMGAGIAQWLSARGVNVNLRDISPTAISSGLDRVRELNETAVRRHILTPVDAERAFDRIHPGTGTKPFGPVDLVIEAAVEDPAIKEQLFRELDAALPPDVLLATNTSALSITRIAGATRHPERVLGIHFFNPVNRMQLVEVIRHKLAAPAAISRAVKYVQQIGKLPVLAHDRPGFIVNRILLPYLVEAARMVCSGIPSRAVDEAMLDFGMPMGPLRLLDEVGLDVARHVAATLERELAHLPKSPPLIEAMLKEGLRGRKSGTGFYIHRPSVEHARPNPDVSRLCDDWGVEAPRKTIADRLVLLMVNEAARCLAEHVAEKPDDIDFAMIMGAGWAPFRGGPLRYADSVGPVKIVAHLEQFARSEHHYAPCELLVENARTHQPFHEH